MAILKSAKLLREEITESRTPLADYNIKKDKQNGIIKILPIKCLNDFIAILQFKVECDISLPDDQLYKNEGIVVGVGPGLPDNAGGRVKSQLEIGDVVLFSNRNVAMDISTEVEPYKDKRLIIISEKNLICKLPSVPFEMV